MLYCLLQEEDNPTLHMVSAFLLFDGRSNDEDTTFEMMYEEGVFPRLVDLIQNPAVQEDTRLHQMLLELMYESSRIQRLKWEDFSTSASHFTPRTCQAVPEQYADRVKHSGRKRFFYSLSP